MCAGESCVTIVDTLPYRGSIPALYRCDVDCRGGAVSIYKSGTTQRGQRQSGNGRRGDNRRPAAPVQETRRRA
ncbi:hypothetical protein EVAR_98967_1 [Eumeta japonica]|uniref:Uncharacterized protein n=1 Tax=Eumeta variegata TaxID=151549 RepID=A0A4C1YRK1_EUMVA|nr:hypothetical protein EVAR_98967_1 [Eumeta japonica]